MAWVLSISGRKGGVGKSTTSLAFAGAVLADGATCLLVDMDSQCSLTQQLLAINAADDIGPRNTCEALQLGADLSSLMLPVQQMPGLHLLPSRPELKLRGASLLPLGLAPVDVVIVDCAPNTTSDETMAAMISSHAVLTPTSCKPNDVQTLPMTITAVGHAQGISPDLVHVGILLTQHDTRQTVQKDYEKLVRDTFGSLVLKQTTPLAVDFNEANAVRLAVPQFAPKSKATKAVRAAWAEVMKRYQAVSKQRAAA
jgi:chromosome partitioning protein